VYPSLERNYAIKMKKACETFSNLKGGRNIKYDNNLPKISKVDLLPSSKSCCKKQWPVAHMPEEEQNDKYISNQFMGKNGCVCMEKETFTTLGRRSGNAESIEGYDTIDSASHYGSYK